MFDFIDLPTWIAGAVIVVGVMQWCKNLLSKIPSKAWAFVLPIISVGTAFASAIKDEDYSIIVWNALGIWAISQLGYELIVQKIKERLGAKKEDA